MQFVANDALIVEIELHEDGLVEQPPALVGGLAVQLLEVVEQVEGRFEDGGPGVDLVVQLTELLSESGPLFLDAVETPADLGSGQLAVRCQVEQVLFLHVKLGQVGLELVLKQMAGGPVVGNGVLHQGTQLVAKALFKLDGGVVPEDSVLDLVHVPVGGGAEVLLLGAAEEVPVDATPTNGPLDEHASFAPVLVMAAPTPQAALQVVVVLVPALTGGGAGLKDLLDPVEDLRRHEALVPASVLDAFVGHVAEVVAVAEDDRQPGVTDGAARVAAAGTGGEAAVGQGVAELLFAVLVGSEQLEGQGDEVAALRIDGHGPDLPAVLELVADVEVADLGAAKGAAVLGLLAHLVADVGAVFGGAVLVVRGEQPVHELADRCVVDALGC